VTSEGDSLGLVGTTIEEKYAIESVVGQGGFATVYRATHTVWKRPVAVKVFKALGDAGTGQRQKLLDEFIQEGALLAELSERSSAIVQARDVGMLTTPKGDSVPFMVLEWLDGRTLDELLVSERDAHLPPRDLEAALRLLDPIADALALAHKKGIAHRDVKPANIFVLGDVTDGSMGVKLLDFGIAKVVQDAQKMGFGKTAGHITSFTPLYGAPEQFDRTHGATGPWTDVFALALVLAEVLSGREPMGGDTLVQLAYASTDPTTRPTPRTLGVAVSDAVEAVFRRAVAVAAADRYATAGDFWSALRAAAAASDSRIASSSVRSLDALAATAVAPDVTSPVSAGPSPVSATAPAPASASASASASAPAPASASASAKGSRSLLAAIAGAVIVLGGLGAFALRNGITGTSPPGGIRSAAATVASGASMASATASAAPAPAACPEGMLPIPGGEFFMGSDEKDALDFEKPAHKVKLSPYCIDELEVTVAQYKQCSDRGGCRRAGKENVWPGIKPAQQKVYDPLCNANDPEAKAKHPVNCVDWDQAREACEARGARLPTEAEWELAARGPDGRIYPWGDEPPSAHHLNACGKECFAWEKAHPDPDNPPAWMYPEDDGWVHTAPVGSFPKGKSRYGVQDVVGNVWEWVADYYADYDKAQAGPMAVDPKGPAAGAERVIRGGGWNGGQPSWVRPSFRFRAAPTTRSHGFGFRCAKSR